MPEIELELSLNRSSGVLAGVVAGLAQAGIELKSQKLKRENEGSGGWLTILGEGEPPAPAVLAERLNNTRGVDRLMRMVVDGETLLAEGKPLADQIQAGDLAELSAGSEGHAHAPQAAAGSAYLRDPEPAGDSHLVDSRPTPTIEESPILSDPEGDKVPQSRPAAREARSWPTSGDELPPLLVEDEPAEAEPPQNRPVPAAEFNHLAEEEFSAALGADPSGNDEADEEPAASLDAGTADSRKDQPVPELVAEPSTGDNLADAPERKEQEDEESAGDAGADASGGEKPPDRMHATIRRRRRRRK